ncbi:hypothetical protein U1Q18_036650, partial [Sarracenia purpurea var. burkii]
MAASTRRSTGQILRSLSPTGRFYTSSRKPPLHSYSAFASSGSSFSSRSPTFHRSTSPTLVNMSGSSPPSPSVRFSIDRPISPSRSISASSRNQVVKKRSNNLLSNRASAQRRTCMCSPTTHPGSFRCSLHKNFNNHAASYPSNRLNARRSAMTNSLVRIGTVEGDLVRRALAALIRPSSHQQRRRVAFHSRPSRLSIISRRRHALVARIPALTGGGGQVVLVACEFLKNRPVKIAYGMATDGVICGLKSISRWQQALELRIPGPDGGCDGGGD